MSNPDRAKALIVVDMQNAVVADAHDRAGVIERIAALAERARAAQAPVVWVQHVSDELPAGSDEGKLVDELTPADGEPLVVKHYGDSFEATELDELLTKHQVSHIVVTGAQTDACIRSTLHGGLVRGYDVTLVADGHTTEDMRQWGAPIGPEDAIAYTNMYWSFSAAEGRTGRTVPSDEIDFS